MNTSSTKTMRLHMWVKGRVQTVGFRAFAQHEAVKIGVVGWVRNVGYDTVEATAEGNKEQIDQFIMVMKRGPVGSRVDDWREEWEPVTGEFSSFIIKASA